MSKSPPYAWHPSPLGCDIDQVHNISDFQQCLLVEYGADYLPKSLY